MKQKGTKKIVIVLIILLIVGIGAIGGIVASLANSGSSGKSHIADNSDDDDDDDEDDDNNVTPGSGENDPSPTATPAPTNTPVPEENGSFTLMVYLTGSNLETGGSHASRQIKEILAANSSKNVNIVIQTGGSTVWHYPGVQGGKVQRFHVENKKLVEKKNLGKIQMSKASTLSDFISWSKMTYPADRYAICLFNHGGSATGGYGNDELFNMKAMSLDQMDKAFKDGGVHFDFIGFDCCEMSNIETAYILSNHADYLVASESVSYIYYGFQYTEFINKIVDNPKIDTLTICKTIADEFAKANDLLKKSFSMATHTIAVTDLSKVAPLYKSMVSFMTELDGYLLDGKSSTNIANIRYHVKYYGSPNSELIDIKDFAELCKIKATDDVLKKLGNAVVYNKTDIKKSCGLGMYMPYNNLSVFASTYNSIKGYFKDKGYLKCLFDMANMMAYNSTDSADRKYSWYDASIGKKAMANVTPISTGNKIDFTLNSEGVYEYSLANGVAYKLADCAEQVYLDLGNNTLCYLGKRDTTLQEVGSVKLNYDRTWYTINGKLVPVVYQGRDQKINGDQYTYSYIPAVLNKKSGVEESVYLVVTFDYGKADGKIVGYQLRNSQFDTLQQSANSFEIGDSITINYLYTDYNFGSITEKKTNNTIAFNGTPIELKTMNLPAGYTYYYRKQLHDYFGRTYHSTLLKGNT